MGRAVGYTLLTTLVGLVVLVAGTTVARSLDQSFRDAAARLEQMR
jgi:Flp pilus assembly pilin Flp